MHLQARRKRASATSCKRASTLEDGTPPERDVVLLFRRRNSRKRNLIRPGRAAVGRGTSPARPAGSTQREPGGAAHTREGQTQSIGFWVTGANMGEFLCWSLVTVGREPSGIGGILHPSRCRHFARSIVPLRTGVQRSPVFSRRLPIVRMVNSDGSNPCCTSSHRNGVETVAPGCGRTE